MTDEPTKTTVENIPSVTGSISGIASANAPFIYFEDAPFFGLLNGVGKITVSSSRQIASGPERSVLFDQVLVAHLVGNIQATRALRAALDGIILMQSRSLKGRRTSSSFGASLFALFFSFPSFISDCGLCEVLRARKSAAAGSSLFGVRFYRWFRRRHCIMGDTRISSRSIGVILSRPSHVLTHHRRLAPSDTGIRWRNRR
jgi:hypothetical protein